MVIKKTQKKNKQNDNPDIHYANCNAKNVKKILAKTFDSNHTIILSCHDECIDKI